MTNSKEILRYDVSDSVELNNTLSSITITPVLPLLLNVAYKKIGIIYIQFSVCIDEINFCVHCYVRIVCYDTVACRCNLVYSIRCL